MRKLGSYKSVNYFYFVLVTCKIKLEMATEKLISLGKEMGLSGEKLFEYVQNKEKEI